MNQNVLLTSLLSYQNGQLRIYLKSHFPLQIIAQTFKILQRLSPHFLINYLYSEQENLINQHQLSTLHTIITKHSHIFVQIKIIKDPTYKISVFMAHFL